MYVHYTDMKHWFDDEDEVWTADIVVRVRGIGRPDTAALADSIEQCAQRFTESVTDRRGATLDS